MRTRRRARTRDIPRVLRNFRLYQNDMKHTFLLFSAAVLVPLVSAFGYDLHTKALTPVAELERPAGPPVTLVKDGKPVFAVVVERAGVRTANEDFLKEIPQAVKSAGNAE